MLKHIHSFLSRHSSEATRKFSSPLLSACHGYSQGNETTNAPSRDFSVSQIGDILQEQSQPSSRPISGQRHPSTSSAYQGRRSFAASSTEPEFDASQEAVNMQTLQSALQSHFPLVHDHQVSACMWSAHPAQGAPHSSPCLSSLLATHNSGKCDCPAGASDAGSFCDEGAERAPVSTGARGR